MEKIKGLIDAPFTPFYENGEVNYEPIEAYAKLLVKNGLKGVFINGSSGEGYMLTDEERMKLAERWVEVAPSGFKVIVHVGSTCVKASHKLAAHAQKIGAWGIGAMASPFPKVNRIEELVKYCEEIASGAPELPFYYYHIPAFNGAFLPMVELLKAVDGRIPNFAGIKYTYESLYEYNQCRLYKDGKFDMLHGQDETILPCLAMARCTRRHRRDNQLQRQRTDRDTRSLGCRRPRNSTRTPELLTGSDQRDLSLSRQYRGWQADHEADRARFR